RAGPEPRDVVAHHAREEGHAVGTGRAHQRAEAHVDQRRAPGEHAVLRLRVAEMARQRDATVVVVRCAGRREMRVQGGLDHWTPPCPARSGLTRAAKTRQSPIVGDSPATYEDILYEARDGIAWITINRPQVLNAFRARTVDELIAAFRAAWHDADVGVAVLTGAGERAFSSGGDQSERNQDGYGGGGRGPGPDLHGPP